MTGREAAVVREVLAMARDDLGLPGSPPAADAPLAGALDSLALLSLVVAVEDRYRVVLTDDDAARARTLEELARLVVARADPAALPPEGAP